MIRKQKPQFVLECGTGKSTFIIAQAMLDYCYDLYDGDIKLVSMEHDEKWYSVQKDIFPDKFKSFVSVTYSPQDLYQYSFVLGTTYKDIPDYPYDFVFVDGPKSDFASKGLPRMCNMSFIEVLEKSNKPVSGIIDKRYNTVLAYNALLTPGLIKFNRIWGVGIIEKSEKDDLLLLNPPLVKRLLVPHLVKMQYKNPF